MSEKIIRLRKSSKNTNNDLKKETALAWKKNVNFSFHICDNAL